MRELITVLTVALVIFLLLTTELPIPFGTVHTTSMEPTISSGETFLALPPGILGGVSVGDIAVFAGDDGWTVHRIEEYGDEFAITAGDANIFTDQAAGDRPIHRSQIIGIVPTVADRPLTALLPQLNQVSTIILGGILIGISQIRTADNTTTMLTPLVLGLLAAGLVVVTWISGSAHPIETETIHNTGPLPLVAIGSETATTLWPGQRITDVEESIQTVPGWAPEPILAVGQTSGGWFTIGLIAGTVAFAITVMAKLLGVICTRQ